MRGDQAARDRVVADMAHAGDRHRGEGVGQPHRIEPLHLELLLDHPGVRRDGLDAGQLAAEAPVRVRRDPVLAGEGVEGGEPPVGRRPGSAPVNTGVSLSMQQAGVQVDDGVGHLAGAGAGVAEPAPPAEDAASLGPAGQRGDDHGGHEARRLPPRDRRPDGPAGRPGPLVAEPGLVGPPDRGPVHQQEDEEGRHLQRDGPFPPRPCAEGAADHEVGEGRGQRRTAPIATGRPPSRRGWRPARCPAPPSACSRSWWSPA